MHINSDHVTETEPHLFTGFISDLGVPPGRVPERITTSLGNRQDLMLHRVDRKNNKFIYRQSMGCVYVDLYND